MRFYCIYIRQCIAFGSAGSSSISATFSDWLISPENRRKQDVLLASTRYSCSVTEHPHRNCTGMPRKYMFSGNNFLNSRWSFLACTNNGVRLKSLHVDSLLFHEPKATAASVHRFIGSFKVGGMDSKATNSTERYTQFVTATVWSFNTMHSPS